MVRTARSRRWLVAGAVVVALALIAAAILPWFLLRRPRNEIEAVLAAHEEVVRAAIDGDYGKIWDLQSEGHFFLAKLDRAAAVRACREADERWPEQRRREVERLRSLRILGVEVSGPTASVRCDPADWVGQPYGDLVLGATDDFSFQYVLRDGAWRLWGIHFMSPMKFQTLDRKIDAPLARTEVVPDVLVTVGREGLAEEGQRLLAEELRRIADDAPGERVVHVDLAPDVTWDTALRAFRTCQLADLGPVSLAASTPDGPEPGVRVNGRLVGGPPAPPLPEDRRLEAGARAIRLAGAAR